MNEIDNLTSNFNQSFEKDAVTSLQNFMNNSDGFTNSVYLSDTLLNSNGSNLSATNWRDTYKPALDLLLLTLLIVVMLSMGCAVTWQNLFLHLKKPFGFFIGIFSQFIIMPLSAFCITLLSGIQGLHATGVLIISCCPGGVISSTFSYFCDGDVALSVAMTAASTLIAIGMMPFNMWLYGRHFESEDLIIPYEKMAFSLIIVTSPAIIGIMVNWKFSRIAKFITKVGSYCTVVLSFICITMEVVLFPNMFTDVPFKLYASIFSLPLIGLTLGYGLAAVLKQAKNIRKTIAVECGVQNVPVALTVIALSFPIEMQEDLVLLPWLYAFAMMSSCAVICLVYQCSKKYSKKDVLSTCEDDIEKRLDPLLEETNETKFVNGSKIQIKPSIIKASEDVSETRI